MYTRLETSDIKELAAAVERYLLSDEQAQLLVGREGCMFNVSISSNSLPRSPAESAGAG